eukprot:Sspe_Gene.84287::Locus_55323_Transcript_1_1_Confidence_1.000_Length_1433::g.84287::m.84287
MSSEKMAEEGSEAYTEWFKACGGKIHPDVEALPVPEMGGGMGVVAKRKLSPGLVVAAAPLKLLFNTTKARSSPTFNAVIEECKKAGLPLRPLHIIPFYMAFEDGLPNSAWKPWLRRLPPSYDTLLEASEAEVEGIWCQRRKAEVVREQKAARKLYEEMQSVLSSVRITEGPPEEIAAVEGLRALEWRAFIRYYCSVMSRGFFHDVDSANADVWTLIPWLDYFNYTDGPGHDACYDPVSKHFQVTTTSVVEAGDQILLHYGTYSNFDLALWYGFVLPSNRCVEYRFSMGTDANGHIICDGYEWLDEILARLTKAEKMPLDLNWKEATEKWQTQGRDSLIAGKLAMSWTISKRKGSAGFSCRSPPKLSENLQKSVLCLAGMVSTVNDSYEVGARILHALCETELKEEWVRPPAPPCPTSQTSKNIEAMCSMEHSFLAALAEVDGPTWIASLSQ